MISHKLKLMEEKEENENKKTKNIKKDFKGTQLTGFRDKLVAIKSFCSLR